MTLCCLPALMATFKPSCLQAAGWQLQRVPVYIALTGPSSRGHLLLHQQNQLLPSPRLQR